jgi:hypothetical protein
VRSGKREIANWRLLGSNGGFAGKLELQRPTPPERAEAGSNAFEPCGD